MRSVIAGSLRRNTRRYVATTVAVAIAVAFIVVTNGLATSMRHGMAASVEQTYRKADLVVRVSEPSDVDKVDAWAQRKGAATSVTSTGFGTAKSASGRTIGDPTYGAVLGTIASAPKANSRHLTAGHLPTAANEVVVTTAAARDARLKLGDTVTISSTSTSGEPVQLRATISGEVKSTQQAPQDLLLTWPAASALGVFSPSDVSVTLPRGTDTNAAKSSLKQATGRSVVTREAFVKKQVADQLGNGVDIISYILLIFAAIAVFVASMVIANTFTIVFAQRTRDFALLRCIGATRRQVLRSVRAEALVLAVGSAVVGLGVGVAGAAGLVGLLRALVLPDALGSVGFTPTWMIGAFALGVALTVAAAWWPTRQVVRVTPLEALRPATTNPTKGRAGIIRLTLAALMSVTGGGMLMLAINGQSIADMLVGGAVSFLGVLLLGPVLVPLVMRTIGLVAARCGAPARFAVHNALRNPRRSSATTAALMVGVTLTTAVLTGVASTRASAQSSMDANYPVDISVTANNAGALTAGTLKRVASTDGISAAAALPGTTARIADQDVTVVAVGASTSAVTRSPRNLTPKPGTVLVQQSSSFSGMRVVTISADGHTLRLRAVSSGAEWGSPLLVSPGTLAELTGRPQTMAIWAHATPDAGTGTQKAVDNAVGTTGTVVGGLAMRTQIDKALDITSWSILGLLSIAVLIALVGIANTLGLSVLERQRENSLLRALGLTRRQLRRALGTEGVLLALTAVIIGTTLGLTYAWVGVHTLVTQVTRSHAGVSLPLEQLLVVALVAVGAGVLATVIPARRAARVSPAAGLTMD